jgi:hypothetical protein
MEPISPKVTALYGKWTTASGQVADVRGYDLKLHLWYGDIDGLGTQWDYRGKHLLNPKYDLQEREEKNPNE